jgi:hypothetical protein
LKEQQSPQGRSATVKPMQAAQWQLSYIGGHQQTRTGDMDPVRLLIEAAAVEIGSFYIVHKWIQLTGGFGGKPKAVPRGVGRLLRRRR